MKTSFKLGLKSAILLLGLFTLSAANAQAIFPTWGNIADNIALSLTSFGNATQTLCWVMSFVTGAGACFKFVAYAKDPDREKVSTPLLMLGVAGIFFAIPMIISSSAQTTFGNTQIQQSVHAVSTGG